MMKWLVVAAAVSLSAPAAASTDAVSPAREYAEMVLLLSQSDFEIRLAAKSIYYAGGKQQALMDVLAEVTWQACSGKESVVPDTLAWLSKALGVSGQNRYAGVLDYCLSRMTNGNLVKHLKAARDNLQGTATSSFEGGRVNLANLRSSPDWAPGAATKTHLNREFDALREGRSLEEIMRLFGRPQQVHGTNVEGRSVGRMVRIRTSQDMIVYEYQDLGALHFGYDEAIRHWTLGGGTTRSGLVWIRGAGRFGPATDLIAEGDIGELEQIVKQLRNQERIDRATLDLIATRIYRSHLETDNDLADQLARLCQILGNSGDGRYKKFLGKIESVAADKTLRRHAGKAADRLPGGVAEQFMPWTGKYL